MNNEILSKLLMGNGVFSETIHYIINEKGTWYEYCDIVKILEFTDVYSDYLYNELHYDEILPHKSEKENKFGEVHYSTRNFIHSNTVIEIIDNEIKKGKRAQILKRELMKLETNIYLIEEDENESSLDRALYELGQEIIKNNYCEWEVTLKPDKKPEITINHYPKLKTNSQPPSWLKEIVK